jgi:hypothetical protein
LSFQKSTTTLKQEVLEICGELTDGTSPFDAKATSYIDDVHRALISGNNLFDISCMEPWVWAQRKNPIILTLQPSVTGAASLTEGSTIGAFSVAPTISLEGRYLCIESNTDPYMITSHTANSTAFSIDQGALMSTGSYNYTAIQYDYQAVNDILIVNSRNCKIDFSEGGAQLTATLAFGSYSPSALCADIAAKMTAASGAQTYTTSFDSITRKFTIVQGGTTFSLLFGSGTNGYISASGLLGYDVNDYTCAVTYTSAYALSGITRMSKPITMYKNSPVYDQAARDSGKIFMIDDNTFLRDYPMNRLTNQIPDKFCIINQATDGILTLRFNGSVGSVTRIEVNDIPVARKLFDNANSYPLVPGDFSKFLVYAAAHFIQTDKSDSKAADSATKAIQQLKALISFNRQGSQIAGNKFGQLVARPDQIKRPWGTGDAY